MKDILLLLWNCNDCCHVKLSFDLKKGYEDSPTGKNGNTLVLLYSFSNKGFEEILNKYGIEKQKAPILIKNNLEIINNVEDIINYMQENYKE